MSSYSTPDKAKLNYHAGAMLRSHFIAEHSGIQFSNDGEKDMLLAGLVFHFCCSPEQDVDINSTIELEYSSSTTNIICQKGNYYCFTSIYRQTILQHSGKNS